MPTEGHSGLSRKPSGGGFRSDLLQTATEFIVVAFCTLAFFFTAAGVFHSLLQKDAAGHRDFVEYWAAGQQLSHHANPYDEQQLLRLERSAGLPPDIPVMLVRSPPVVLPLVAPLGYLSPHVAELSWCSTLLALLLASVWMVRCLHGRPPTAIDTLAYFFAPAMACLLVGQMSMLVLFGIVLFLFLHRSRPMLAGAALWFCLPKPHLLLPFAVVLLLWTLERRRYRVLVGAGLMVAATAAIAYVLDPHAWAQCAQLARDSRADLIPLPCLANALRRAIAPGAIWLQYLPAALGCLWALDYYRRHRLNWDWTSHGSLLLLVSLVVAPYSWFTDQVVAIPALLHGLYIARSRGLVAFLGLASAAVQLAIFGGGTRFLHSPWLLWTAPFWLGWYLLATRTAPADPAAIPQKPSPAPGALPSGLHLS